MNTYFWQPSRETQDWHVLLFFFSSDKENLLELANFQMKGKTAFVRPWIELIAAECLPRELAVDGKRQQEAQVKCQGFSLIMVIRGEMKGSLSTMGIQPLLSVNAITGADTTL